VAAPQGLGGLNFRNLEVMNEAMLMKALWRLASGSECQWDEVVAAKYLLIGPCSTALWTSKRIMNQARD
jgi:hypothetical protein